MLMILLKRWVKKVSVGLAVLPLLFPGGPAIMAGSLAEAREIEPLRAGRASASEVRGYILRYVRGVLKPRFRRFSHAIVNVILQESRRFSFDPLLIVAIIEQESRFLPTARGTRGELGLMQLKPKTARWLAGKIEFPWKGKKSLLDPITNIRLGTAYLALLRDRFDQKTHLYVAAYNSGVSTVLRALGSRRLPREYVAGVMTRYYRHSAGLAVRPATI